MSRIDTVETEVFKFEELTEEAKQTALESFSDINVEFDWWAHTYEDAERVGLKITSFDTYHRGVEGEFNETLLDVCKTIKTEHGQMCDTYQTAARYLASYYAAKKEFRKTRDYRDGYSFEEISDYEDLEHEFLNDLLEDYLSLLSREYDYQTSEEAILETIKINEYEFTAEGKLY